MAAHITVTDSGTVSEYDMLIIENCASFTVTHPESAEGLEFTYSQSGSEISYNGLEGTAKADNYILNFLYNCLIKAQNLPAEVNKSKNYTVESAVDNMPFSLVLSGEGLPLTFTSKGTQICFTNTAVLN